MCCKFKEKMKRNSNEFNFPDCEDKYFFLWVGLFPCYVNQYNQEKLKNWHKMFQLFSLTINFGFFPTVLKWHNTSTHFTPFVSIMKFLSGGDTVQKCTMAVWIFHLMRHIWIANNTLTFYCLLCYKWDQWEHLLILLL